MTEVSAVTLPDIADLGGGRLSSLVSRLTSVGTWDASFRWKTCLAGCLLLRLLLRLEMAAIEFIVSLSLTPFEMLPIVSLSPARSLSPFSFFSPPRENLGSKVAKS